MPFMQFLTHDTRLLAVFMPDLSMRTIPRMLLLGLWLLTAVPAPAASERDPWEGMNRKTQAFNDFIDDWLLKPVARGYQAVMPGAVDRSVSRFFSNLQELPDVVDFGLQGEWHASGGSLVRFLGNSTLGIGGLFDPVGAMGVPNRDTRFGTTLGKWGVGSGPYLVLPLLGPSTLRNAAGLPMDWSLDPVTLPWTVVDQESLRYGLMALDVVDTRADLLSFEEAVVGDRYSFLRDTYLQKSDFDVHGAPKEDPFLDDLPEEAAPSTPEPGAG